MICLEDVPCLEVLVHVPRALPGCGRALPSRCGPYWLCGTCLDRDMRVGQIRCPICRHSLGTRRRALGARLPKTHPPRGHLRPRWRALATKLDPVAVAGGA